MTRNQLEAAVEASVKNAAGGTAFHVERYSGQAGSLAELDDWISGVQLPAVAIFYDGKTIAERGEDGVLETQRITVKLWIVHDRLRGVETATVAPGGINELLELLENRLSGVAVGTLCTPLQFLSDAPVIEASNSGRVLWEQVWQFNFTKEY